MAGKTPAASGSGPTSPKTSGLEMGGHSSPVLPEPQAPSLLDCTEFISIRAGVNAVTRLHHGRGCRGHTQRGQAGAPWFPTPVAPVVNQ